MNWIQELNNMYKKLEINGHQETKEEIYDAQLSGGTGGEIFLLVTNKLKELRDSKPDIYRLIKEEADQILHYGVLIGYLSES